MLSDTPVAFAANSPATRPMSPGDRPLAIYSWVDAGQPSIIPMTWQPTNSTGPALFLRGPMPGAFAASLTDLIANGPAVDHWREWMRNYYRRLNPAPKRIVLDEEADGIDYWQLFSKPTPPADRVALFKSVWDNPAAYAKLPQAVKAFKPEDFATPTGRGHPAVIAWNQFAADVMHKALRQVCFDPAVEAFGKTIEVSNFVDMETDTALFDPNGWPVANGLMGNWSSPACYLSNTGNLYQNRAKPVIWNNFIDGLNYVRACLNYSWRVAPWVSYPSYHEGNIGDKPLKALWAELIEHLKASGIRDFLYWNPREGAAPGDDAFAAAVFTKEIASTGGAKFASIPLDADEVRTGQKVTRYADWIKMKQ